MLFTHDIDSKEKWMAVKDQVSLVYPLAKYICQKAHIATDHIQQMCPSTNAVFRSGNKVIKIYAPAVAGYQAELDYLRELYALDKISCPSVRSPELLEAGCLHDKYDFFYTIQSYIPGVPANIYLSENGRKGLNKLCDGLNLFIEYLQSIEVGESDFYLLSKRSIPRDKVSTSTCRSFFIHGDLSCSNVLLNHGELAITDFEDWSVAPACTEYPAIVFDLFHLNSDAIRAFFKREVSFDLACIIAEGIRFHHDSNSYMQQIFYDWSKENVDTSAKELTSRLFSILTD